MQSSKSFSTITNIRFFRFSPAVIKTNFFEPAFGYTEQQQNAVYKDCEQTYPLMRPGNPEDVAQAVAFLASSKASFISGATLEVDGGSMWTSRGPVQN